MSSISWVTTRVSPPQICSASIKSEPSDEQKGEFKAQYERDFQWENKGAGKILARRAEDDYLLSISEVVHWNTC
jgi:hypothetical protein